MSAGDDSDLGQFVGKPSTEHRHVLRAPEELSDKVVLAFARALGCSVSWEVSKFGGPCEYTITRLTPLTPAHDGILAAYGLVRLYERTSED